MLNRIVCLNLDSRIHEQERIAKEFNEVGLNIEFFLAGDGSLPAKYDYIDVEPPYTRYGYPAWTLRSNSWNAYACFKKIIQKAKDDHLASVTLVEDDCCILPYFNQNLKQVRKELCNLPVPDMLYFCANHTWTPTTQLSPYILKLNGSGGFQFVSISNRLFDKFLESPMDEPIDSFAGKKIHPYYNCYATWPSLAIPKAGYSYCEGHSYDNTKLYLNKGC